MKKAIMCMLQTYSQAEVTVEKLHAAGFLSDDISVLFADKRGTRGFAFQHSTKVPEGAIAGVGTGGVVGGTLGLLAGIGALAIPGVGPLIAAGPVMATLSGMAAGATVGGVAGALVGFGIPEIEAKRYEGKVRGGSILVAVHTERPDEVTRAERIFREVRGQDVCSTMEAGVPSSSPAYHRP
jgi:hypothetical protein